MIGVDERTNMAVKTRADCQAWNLDHDVLGWSSKRVVWEISVPNVVAFMLY